MADDFAQHCLRAMRAVTRESGHPSAYPDTLRDDAPPCNSTCTPLTPFRRGATRINAAWSWRGSDDCERTAKDALQSLSDGRVHCRKR
jgi:hypothetical protein